MCCHSIRVTSSQKQHKFVLVFFFVCSFHWLFISICFWFRKKKVRKWIENKIEKNNWKKSGWKSREENTFVKTIWKLKVTVCSLVIWKWSTNQYLNKVHIESTRRCNLLLFGLTDCVYYTCSRIFFLNL